MSEYVGEAKWYIVYTSSGYEYKVQDGIRRLVENNNLENEILDTAIPTVEEVKIDKKGKKRVVSTLIMPSYVFIKMIYTNKIWYLVNNLSGVINFVGPGGHPTPISLEEVRRFHLEDVQVDFTLKPGDQIKVIEGSLEGFMGTVEEADNENKTVKVKISMFGRDMPVDLEFSQIEKI